jgi:hypothetical protein
MIRKTKIEYCVVMDFWLTCKDICNLTLWSNVILLPSYSCGFFHTISYNKSRILKIWSVVVSFNTCLMQILINHETLTISQHCRSPRCRLYIHSTPLVLKTVKLQCGVEQGTTILFPLTKGFWFQRSPWSCIVKFSLLHWISQLICVTIHNYTMW